MVFGTFVRHYCKLILDIFQMKVAVIKRSNVQSITTFTRGKGLSGLYYRPEKSKSSRNLVVNFPDLNVGSSINLMWKGMVVFTPSMTIS